MAPSRLQSSLRTTVTGLAVNFGLAGIKLVAGILGHSYALIADAIESMSDLFSSLIVWRGVVVANRPADAQHPYGHGKAEALAGASVSVMLIGAALVIFIESVREIRTPHSVPAPFTLLVLLGVILIKEGLYRFVGRIGTQIESAAVQADAWHHRSDAITSAAAALGISIALVGGEKFKDADDWAAMFAALIIGWNGYRMLRPIARELMDAAPEGDVIGQSTLAALAVPGVKRVEKCLARKMGYGFHLDMHVEVDGSLTVATAHALAHTVKDAIRTRQPRVIDVTIHIEPYRVPAKDEG
jgi:cation diffusion facilitator family transporter